MEGRREEREVGKDGEREGHGKRRRKGRKYLKGF